MVTNYQLNHILRTVHEKFKHFGRLSRLDALTEREHVEELVYQLREGGVGYALGSAASAGRVTPQMREAAIEYRSAEGICSIWNYLGLLLSADREQHRNYYVYNVAHQGSLSIMADNIFQPLQTSPNSPYPELGPPLKVNDHCRFILKRRFSPTTGQHEEFAIYPHSSVDRFAAPENLEYTDYDGYIAYGPTVYVGKVVDVLPDKQDAGTLHEMLGIDVPWEKSYLAHGRNVARINLALGGDPWSMLQ